MLLLFNIKILKFLQVNYHKLNELRLEILKDCIGHSQNPTRFMVNYRNK